MPREQTGARPSITPYLDQSAAPPAHLRSLLPAELMEMTRSDGVARTVLCFLDDDGYLANLECVYYDEALSEWPGPAQCAVLLRDNMGYLAAVSLPSGATIQPHEANDRWVSSAPQGDGGLLASTWTGYRESFAADGTETSRIFIK